MAAPGLASRANGAASPIRRGPFRADEPPREDDRLVEPWRDRLDIQRPSVTAAHADDVDVVRALVVDLGEVANRARVVGELLRRAGEPHAEFDPPVDAGRVGRACRLDVGAVHVVLVGRVHEGATREHARHHDVGRPGVGQQQAIDAGGQGVAIAHRHADRLEGMAAGLVGHLGDREDLMPRHTGLGLDREGGHSGGARADADDGVPQELLRRRATQESKRFSG